VERWNRFKYKPERLRLLILISVRYRKFSFQECGTLTKKTKKAQWSEKLARFAIKRSMILEGTVARLVLLGGLSSNQDQEGQHSRRTIRLLKRQALTSGNQKLNAQLEDQNLIIHLERN